MRSRNISRRVFSLLLAVIFLCAMPCKYASAAEEPYVNSVRGTAVTAGVSFYVTDEKFLSAGTFYGSIRPAPYSLLPENIVELKFNYDTSAYFYNKVFTATVNVSILCYSNPYDTSQVYTQYNNINLTIKHDTVTGSPYKGVHFMKFSGAYKFRVIVNSISCPELGTNMPPVLMVEGKTVIKRKYNFSASTSDVTKIEQLPGQVRLSWIPGNYAGAELFDLEYTVVDDSSAAGASIRNYLATSSLIPQAVMDGFFRNNASRVTTAAGTYTLNPMYRAGYLLFRLRGVQFANEFQSSLTAAEQNLRTEGNWNYQAAKLNQPSYQYNIVQLQWHEPNLNWQYTISFAEEGKRKEAIGYFDGVLKNRQNVTLNNSDKKTVIQETIYDALGRDAISVLPAPANDSTIHYFLNFNQNKNNKGYSYKDFAFGASCRTIPDTMSQISGAHHYYSSSNSINDYFFKKYIPKAEGYPFAVKEYTPDNTGRIFAQSGVGKDFQPGSNHETKYYYSKPTQEELDKMFGSEAGNASHYLKNMVVDANGQISVTYINATGKNIATALAGITPPNVEALQSNNGTGTDVNKTLLTSPDFTRDYGANILVGNSSFLAAVSGNYVFNYNFTPLRLDVLHGPNNEFKICNTCYYDLIITVKDNCSQVMHIESKPVAANTVFQTDCNIAPAQVTGSFTVPINFIGEYSVSYQLSVSERALSFYDSVHLVQNTNIRGFNSFVLEKLNNADFKGCFSECTTCLQELGTRTDFINNKVKPLFLQADSLAFTAEFDVWANNLYDSLLAHCSSIQAGCTPSPCDEEKELLLDDVSPGGQYALYDANFNLTDPLHNVLNSRYGLYFVNEDGTPGKIEINGVLYDAGSYAVSNKVFIENFDRGWAEALLPYHPEYCFYQWCLYGTNPDSKAFDLKVQDLEDAATATSLGYFGSVNSLLNADPFFSYSGYGYQYYNQMLDSLNYFSGTMPGYGGPPFNILQYIDYELYCEAFGVAPGSCSLPAWNDACRSPYMEWQLYRDYYLNLKAFFQEKARLANPFFANCKNCFIGTDYTEILVCNAPPASDFTIEIDPTYTSGKRIIVKYKNGEAAYPHKLKLTFSYNYGSFVQTFRAGRSTEMFVVPYSAGDYYAITMVECDLATGGGSGVRTKDDISSDVVETPRAIIPSCPCPTAGSFDAYFTGFQCYNGPQFTVSYYGSQIPPCRTVYVELYWEEMNTGWAGFSTVTFTGSQTSVSDCIYSGIYGGYYYMYISNVYCVDESCFNCGGTQGDPSSLCKDDPLYPYYKDKVRRYASYQNPHTFYPAMMNNYSNYQAQANSNLASECQSNCEAQADIWINAISKCTTNATVLNAIKADMIALCQNNCNSSHPYGASSNAANNQSFESIIRQYIPASSDSCTAELISDPYPYYRQPQFENQVLIQVDNCLSSRYNALKAQYNSAVSAGYVGSFHQWLQKQLKSDYELTQQELTDLETALINNCKYLKAPLRLPVAFSCGSMPACIDSATTMQTYAAFLAKYPGITVSNQYYETLLTNYFNHTFGYALNYEDYQSYIEKCQTGTTNKDLLCNRALTSQVIVKEDVMKCMSDVFDLAIAQAVSEYTVYIDSVRTAFRNAYMGKCMNVDARLTMNAKLYEYHYTLYYYDQSGNLVKTIPPQGVELLTDAQVAQVQSNRLNTNGYCYTSAPELIFNANIITMPREYSYDPVVNGQYSVEAWVKLGNLNITSPQGLFSYNAVTSSPTETGWALVQRNSRLAFIVGTSPKLQVETPLLSSFLSANTWFHIAVTVNNSSAQPVKIFINGNNVPLTYLNNYSPVYNVYAWDNHKLYVGGAFDNSVLTAVTNAGIKQFRWYQRALSVSEIQHNAFNNCFVPASSAAMISYLPVNEGNGNIMEDKVNYNLSTMNGNTNAVWQNYVAGFYPRHKFPTTYEYNSFNQVIRQKSPDAGTASYWYDVMGRLVASQSSEQLTPKNPANNSANRYSYTKYDAIGRTIEVGEKYNGSPLWPVDEDLIPIGAQNPKVSSQLNAWYASGSDRQVTLSIYDAPNTGIVTNAAITNLQLSNSRKRIVSSVFKELKSNSYYDFATHYVYDISGNVKTLFQDLKPMRDVELLIGLPQGVRRMDYDYDLVSGKVNKVYYQKGYGDQFIYRYDYDADNRVTDAFTSRNGLQWQQHAHYYYYLHGPLARVELGKYKVQGTDYAYTLQGWLKGINGHSLDVTKDMAGDGNSSSTAFKNFSRDVYGYSLGYHNNDYKPIGGTPANAFDVSFTAPTGAVGTTGNTGSQLFNGNVSNTTIVLSKINGGQVTGYSYLYDQLNRLLGTRQHNVSGSSWSYGSYNAGYEEKAAYDANGNIKTYVRKGGNVSGLPLAMDNLKYFYYYTNTSNVVSEYDPTQPMPGDVKTLTNQLAHVDDSDPSGNYAVDIDDQNVANYDYDNVGNLIKDNAEGITSINWTVYGKIKQVQKSNGVVINYRYDASGNRVVKEVLNAPGGYNRQFYIRDAGGNVLGIYKDQTDYVDWVEQHLYGSGRLGVWNYGKPLPSVPAAIINDTVQIGNIAYELSNQAGNILSVISDKKIGVSSNSVAVDYYNAEVLSQQDYYPFGMLMPGRSFSSGNSYQYGFSGRQKENEIYGEGNAYNFDARIYDPRIGRWLSVDPLQQKYPSFSPYNYSMNNPVFFYDIDGKDVGVTITRNPQGGGTITFYSTTYVTGVDAEEKVKLYNEAFKKFIDANPGLKTTDGKWNVDIKMDFKVATDEDVKRITSNAQEMAAENMMNIKAPSAGDSRAHSGMRVPGSSDKGEIIDVDPAGNNGKGLRLGTSTASGRFAQMYSKDGGKVAVHEELHNWGLGDYYADVSYQWQMIDNATGKVENSGTTSGSSVSYVGFEDDVMSMGNCINQAHIDDLVNTALKTSEIKKSDNFVMARKVDSGRPNGSTNVSQVPKTRVERTKTKTTTYSNPVYKSAGN